MIIAENLTKRYGSALALDRVSFTINQGDSIALWGSNGAGKTTTLQCLLGIQSFEGKLSVNGIDVRKQGKATRAVIGYVPQVAAFYDMTVTETIRFYARLKKVSKENAQLSLERVQLTPHQHKRVNELSGGMKQRLALAVALLSDPPILLLDEPTANLDVQAQRDFIAMIQNLNKEGKTVVFSSHRLDEVMALANRALVLDHGKLTLECSPSDMAEKLGLYCWLRLWIPATHKQDSLQLLESHGFTCTPNGRAVYVRVSAGNKNAPLRALENAQIPVEDFDLMTQDGTK